jgi:DNA-directed RNA polymerase specialized sigma24 family protein
MVLALHFYGELRASEIADLLAIPAGTAVSRLHYAARALRAVLEADTRVGATAARSIE